MSTKSILLIEDNPEERAILHAYLEFTGGTVIEAENGAEGLRLARAALPDLILLDLRMPGMDGWQTLRHLQADPRTADIPVVALTAQRLEWSTAEEAGFCGYLEKPVTPFCVLSEVERCIGQLRGQPSPEGGHAARAHETAPVDAASFRP
jgi:two-component system, cell cycle response regulator DivK